MSSRMIGKMYVMCKYGKNAKLVAGYVQLHVRIGVLGGFAGFYFVFCLAKLFLILLFLKKIASGTNVA